MTRASFPAALESPATPPRSSPVAASPVASRIVIVRLGSMGDIIHSLPAVAALRRALPAAQIDWVVEERWAALLASRTEFHAAPRSAEKPLVDALQVVDTRAWRKSWLRAATRREMAATLRRLRAAHYDLAIDLQGALKSALLARISGASARQGFARPIERPASLFYTRRIPAQGRHIAEQNVSLALGAIADLTQNSRTGAALDSTSSLEFPLPDDARDAAWAENELRQRSIGPFVLINPGAGWGAKCWPAERFAAVAHALRESGLASVVNAGPGEEELAARVVAASEGAAHAMACPLAGLIALTRRASLCVGGDTGPTHLAAALGVPVVAVYGPTDPARNGPLGSTAIVLRSPGSVTSHARRVQPDEALLSIGIEEVVAAARKLLRQTDSREEHTRS